MPTTITNPLRSLIIASAAAFAVAIAAPTTAAAYDSNISFDGFSLNDDEDLLEQLIELDADDIEELREEMADARAEIRDAIVEIEEAREEVKSAPGGAVIMKVALTTASAVVKTTTGRAFKKVRKELARAERELIDGKDNLSAEEFAETQLAIDVILEELAAIQASLTELTDAMTA